MLKNKFGMTKILVLVLSVLMLVSLVACNKADGPSTDDMNAAIQAAIDAANAEQAAKEAALAASIAADKAAQEAKDAALAESMAKEKAENDAALKKAQEEAKAAADAAAAASKAAKEAADKAAKEAADAAAKAAKEAADKAAKEASEAAQKAKEEADKQASELQAALEAAKAEALKAAEEASKAQAEASKAIEEASKAAAEASAAASKLEETTAPAETTVAPATTPAETTVTPATPIDKTEVLAAYSKLKTEYTYTKQDMYKAADYAELVLLFDKASLDLNNAATVEAATAVLEALKVDVLAIRNVEMAAAEVAALVNALGDIETEVFTTQAEMIVEAEKAYEALKKEYYAYLDCDKYGIDLANGDTVEIATDLGINVADLKKAGAKKAVLESYIKTELLEKMAAIYRNDSRLKFRVEDLAYNLDGSVSVAGDNKTTWNEIIDETYYLYRVLAVVNGGDTAAADLAINWEYKLDDNGNVVRADGTTSEKYQKPIALYTANGTATYYAKDERVFDTKKPTAFFTTEEFIEVYALPTLDKEFETIKAAAVTYLRNQLATDIAAIRTEVEKKINTKYLVVALDANYALDDAVHAFELSIENLSFVEDYKATATLADAKADIYAQLAVAYVDAINEFTTASKATAVEYYTDYVYDAAVRQLDEQYSGEAYQNEIQQAFYAKKLAQAESNKDAFIANVNAAPVYTYEILNSEELRTAYGTKSGNKVTPVKELHKLVDDYGVPTAAFYTYAKQTVIDAIVNNFVVVTAAEGELGNYILMLTTDLAALRERLDPTDNSTVANSLYNSSTRGSEVTYLDGTGLKDGKYYANVTKFQTMVADVEAAIAAIEAIKVEDYTDKEVQLLSPDSSISANKKKAPLFWINETSRDFVMAQFTDAEGNVDQAGLEQFIYDELDNANLGDNWTNVATVTRNDTGLKITYVYTAEQQACKAASDLYANVYGSVHSTILAIRNHVSTYQKKITNTDQYKAILKNVGSNAALKAEVEDIASVYTGYISTYATLDNAMTDNGFEGKTKSDDCITKTHFTVPTSVDDNANEYDMNGVTNDLTKYVTLFEKVFYKSGSNKTQSNVVELYNYRNAAIAALKETVAEFLNSYESATVADVTTVTKTEQTKGWAYDVTPSTESDLTAATAAMLGATTKGAAYEAEVAAKLAAAIKNIEAVRLTTRSKVTDHLGKTIKAEFTTKSSSVYDVTLGTAQAVVNAYMVQILGHQVASDLGYAADTTDVYGNADTWKAADNKTYSNVGSQLFAAYKAYYLGNYESLVVDNFIQGAGSGDVITANFTVDYTGADDIKVAVGSKAFTAPAVPAVEGQSGEWKYTVTLTNVTTYETAVAYNAAKDALTVDDDATDGRTFTFTSVLDSLTITTVETFVGNYEAIEDQIKNVKATDTVTAVATYINVYTITYLDENGLVVGTVKYNEGATTVTNPAVPVKEGYIVEWPIVTPADNDQIIRANYFKAGAMTFVSVDPTDAENVLETKTVALKLVGSTWTVIDEDAFAAIAPKAVAGYTATWEAITVADKAEVKAVYNKFYTVTYTDAETTVTYKFQKNAGVWGWIDGTGAVPTAADKANHVFAGWDKEFALPEASAETAADVAITAKYTAYKTATYIKLDGQTVQCVVKYAQDGTVLEVVDGSGNPLANVIPSAGGATRAWSYELNAANIAKDGFVDRYIYKLAVTE